MKAKLNTPVTKLNNMAGKKEWAKLNNHAVNSSQEEIVTSADLRKDAKQNKAKAR